MAVALGEAGATVICTGRSSVRGRGGSDYDRPETIEETADLVTAAGGRGTALHVDRLRVAALRRAGRRCALAADPGRSRWNQQSVTSAELAREYGVTDIDGAQPDSWARTLSDQPG